MFAETSIKTAMKNLPPSDREVWNLLNWNKDYEGLGKPIGYGFIGNTKNHIYIFLKDGIPVEYKAEDILEKLRNAVIKIL